MVNVTRGLINYSKWLCLKKQWSCLKTANFRGIKIWYPFFIMVVPGLGEWKMKLWFHLHSYLYYIAIRNSVSVLDDANHPKTWLNLSRLSLSKLYNV